MILNNYNENRMVDFNRYYLKSSYSPVGRNYSYRVMTDNRVQAKYAWYLDITPNRMFSLYHNYSIPGKTGLPRCELQDRHLELKEAVVRDNEATEKFPPDLCWVCKQ